MDAGTASAPGGASGAAAPPAPFPNGVLAPPLLFAGPVLIGVLLAYLLFGVLLAQVVQYCQTVSRTEHVAMKILVGLVTVIQLVQLAFISDTAWTTCVLGFVNPINMIKPPPSAPGTGILNGAIALCVQSFFAWKIYTLGAKKTLVMCVSGLIVLLALIQMGAAVGVAALFISIGGSSQELFKLKTPITIGLSTAVLCDLIISITMIVILAKYKENTAFVRTKSLLNTLIVSTIENGMVLTVGAIANLVIYFTRTQDMINIALTYVMGGLYAIVFITTLNRRVVTPARTDGTSISLSEANGFVNSRANQQANIATGRGPAPSYQVRVISSMQSEHSDAKAIGTRNDLGRMEEGGARDIMVSVSKEIHDDESPYGVHEYKS